MGTVDNGLMHRVSFIVRLSLATAVTIALVLLVGERLVSGAVRNGFIAEQAQDYRADAVSIERAAAEADGGEGGLEEAQEVVDAISARPGVAGVELIDVRGRVVAAADPEDIGDIEDGAAIEVARGGEMRAGSEGESHEDAIDFEYIVPLNIAEESFALEVDQDSRVLDVRLAELRRYMLAVGLAGIPFGVAVFLLLGGRRLARRHTDAVERSLRDGLTGLGNHSAFQDALMREIAAAERHGEGLSLALVDVDDFKFCNDKLGHQYGDRVLQGIAAALAGGRKSDACFRIGGDEFAVLLPRTSLLGARCALEDAAARAGAELPGVGLSIGLSVLWSASGDPALFAEQADTAVYEAKRTRGNAIVAFDEISSNTHLSHPDKVRALHQLLDDGEVDVAFQAIWDLDRGEVLGYEALSRPSVKYGFNGPGEAFELAEKTGRAHLLCEVGRRSALAKARELPVHTLLFLNVSPKTLEHDMLSGESLVDAVRAAGLEPHQVVLELTEHATTRLRQVVREVARLRALGFKIALDDVGAGNAGLELLCSVSADFVKIDRSVVVNAVHDASAHGVLEAVIAYARRTGAFVIAEGIESDTQLEFARQPFSSADDLLSGVRGGQGFLLGRPVTGFTVADRIGVLSAR